MKARRLNRRGFSLPLSMVFLLVTVMLSMALVTAATSAMAQVKENKERRQASLTVTSAAKVLAESIKGMTFSCRSETDKNGETDTVYSVTKDNGYTKLADEIAGWMTDAAKEDDGQATAELTLEGMSTSKLTASVCVYRYVESSVGQTQTGETQTGDAAKYPGDIVVSLKVDSASLSAETEDCWTTFRVDGADEGGERSFSQITYYSGSGVYE